MIVIMLLPDFVRVLSRHYLSLALKQYVDGKLFAVHGNASLRDWDSYLRKTVKTVRVELRIIDSVKHSNAAAAMTS